MAVLLVLPDKAWAEIAPILANTNLTLTVHRLSVIGGKRMGSGAKAGSISIRTPVP